MESNTTIGDFDDFNSYLEAVLSDGDESPATPTAGGPKDGVNIKVAIDLQGEQGASTTDGDGCAAASGADLEGTCTTGIYLDYSPAFHLKFVSS